MIAFMLHHNWTYTSLLFSEGSYGENGGKQFVLATRQSRICIAYSTMLSSDVNDEELEGIINKLRAVRARAVVLFLEPQHIKLLINHKGMRNSTKLIFLTSDAGSEQNYGTHFDGNIVTSFPFKLPNDLLQQVLHMTPLSSTDNPWFSEIWQRHYECQYKNNSKPNYFHIDNSSKAVDCADLEHLPLPPSLSTLSPWSATSYDAVMAVAYALDMVIKSECSHLVSDRKELRDCVRHQDLLSVLKNNTFQGTSWPVSFDAHGDVQGRYQFLQYYSTR